VFPGVRSTPFSELLEIEAACDLAAARRLG